MIEIVDKIIEKEGRRWYISNNGKIYPSSTAMLDILFPSSRDFIPEEKLEMGTLCHSEIAKALICTKNNMPYIKYGDKSVEARIDALMNFILKDFNALLAIEFPSIYMGIGYTQDCVVVTKANRERLYDWKFAEKISERYLYQVEFYRRAEAVDEAFIVQVNSKAEVFPVEVKPDLIRWEKIKSAINVRKHLDERKVTHG